MLILYRGATVSSKGYINAVVDALIKAGETEAKKVENQVNRYIKPVIELIKKDFSNLLKGTYEGYSKGHNGSNTIGVRVTVDDKGKISNIELIKNNDDIGYFNKVSADILRDRIIEKQSTDVDTVTNATVSSKGYINAVVEALQNALDPNSNESNKYIRAPKTIISTVGENITLERIKNSFERLPENVKMEIKKAVDVNKLGKTELAVELIFSDESKKVVSIPVIINEKVNGSFKFKSVDEIKKLDSNKYPDGEYYGDSYGFVPQKPIPVKITVTNGKIVNIEVVDSELKRLTYSKEYIDDGRDFAKRFDIISKIVMDNQNPEEIAYKFGILRNVSQQVLDYAKDKDRNLKTYIDALDKIVGKHKFGKDLKTITEKDITEKDRSIKEKIYYLMKIYTTEELGYDSSDYDAVSGATFTATGSSQAIKNALYRASTNVDFYDFRVDDESFKLLYKDGEKLNLDNLKVEFYKKDKSKLVVPYNKFKENKIELVLEDSGKEIDNNTILSEQNLGFDVIKSGLKLKIIHKDSYTFKFLNTILVEPNKIECEIEGFEFREKDKGEWIKTEGYQKGEFAQDLIVNSDSVKGMQGKDIEFRIITKEKES